MAPVSPAVALMVRLTVPEVEEGGVTTMLPLAASDGVRVKLPSPAWVTAVPFTVSVVPDGAPVMVTPVTDSFR